MVAALTARQIQILRALIDEYIATAEPVGSLALEKKYNLGVSPATIRKEMFDLTKMNYLRQPHTSAGRVPTPLAMKFYIDQLMEEKQMSLTEEVKAKEQVREVRQNFDKLMNQVTNALAQQTHALAVATTEEGDSWRAGYGNIMDAPEFSDIGVCRSVFSILEETRKLHELFFERLTGLSPIEILFGEELGWDYFEPVGVVATRFIVKDKNGAIGVIGPFRQNYPYVIPVVRYFGRLIQEMAQ